MPADEYVREWFEKGSHDFTTARLGLKARAPSDTIAVLLQQATEKYLKGYLIAKGWRLKKTHDLRELLDRAVEFNPTFGKYAELARRLTALYVEHRYPSGPPSAELEGEIGSLAEQSQELIELIQTETR
ncbi:MAG: HEPN domain-containing protein [Chloroflexi bacterium]|nr:HEPN domain-containing protein [Chloroflexota bacterium]